MTFQYTLTVAWMEIPSKTLVFIFFLDEASCCGGWQRRNHPEHFHAQEGEQREDHAIRQEKWVMEKVTQSYSMQYLWSIKIKNPGSVSLCVNGPVTCYVLSVTYFHLRPFTYFSHSDTYCCQVRFDFPKSCENEITNYSRVWGSPNYRLGHR